MKKIIFLSIALSVSSISMIKAQSFLDKIDNMVNKADNAANTADRASKTGGKISSLFGKKNKNKQAEDKASEGSTTVIKISKIDLVSLKKLNNIITDSKGVTSSNMKYNSASSSITVVHTGSTSKLLDNIQSKAKDIFTDKNIQGIDEGLIEINMK